MKNPKISEDSVSFFLRNIQKFPMLDAKEEYELAKKWHEQMIMLLQEN